MSSFIDRDINQVRGLIDKLEKTRALQCSSSVAQYEDGSILQNLDDARILVDKYSEIYIEQNIDVLGEIEAKLNSLRGRDNLESDVEYLNIKNSIDKLVAIAIDVKKSCDRFNGDVNKIKY